MSSSIPPVAPATPEQLAAAEAALAVERQREAALGLFARRMTHDMSNFVTVIRTYSELLLGDLPPEAATRTDVEEIYRAADAIVEYLQRVARFSRSAGTRPGIVTIDELLRDVTAQFNASRGSDAVRVTTALDCHATARVDANWLSDAVREVLVNAVEAAPAGTQVQLGSWDTILPAAIVDAGVPIAAGRWVVIEVADSGSGFASEVRNNAADPFVTTKAGVRGAGFGLTLARGVAWQASGQLVCDSGKPDDTRIRIWLPAVSATE